MHGAEGGRHRDHGSIDGRGIIHLRDEIAMAAGSGNEVGEGLSGKNAAIPLGQFRDAPHDATLPEVSIFGAEIAGTRAGAERREEVAQVAPRLDAALALHGERGRRSEDAELMAMS